MRPLFLMRTKMHILFVVLVIIFALTKTRLDGLLLSIIHGRFMWSWVLGSRLQALSSPTSRYQ